MSSADVDVALDLPLADDLPCDDMDGDGVGLGGATCNRLDDVFAFKFCFLPKSRTMMGSRSAMFLGVHLMTDGPINNVEGQNQPS